MKIKRYNQIKTCLISTPLKDFAESSIKKNFPLYLNSLSQIGGLYYPLSLLKLITLYDLKIDQKPIWDYLDFSLKSNELSKFYNYTDIRDFLRFYEFKDKILFTESLKEFENSVSRGLFLFSEEELSDLKILKKKIWKKKLFVWERSWFKYNFPFDNSKVFLENLEFFEEFKSSRFEMKTTISGSVILIDNQLKYNIKIEDYDEEDSENIDFLKTLFYKKKNNFDSYFFDNPKFQFDNLSYEVLTQQNAKLYAEYLKENYYVFDTHDYVMKKNKKIQPIETFISFLTLQNKYKIVFFNNSKRLKIDNKNEFKENFKLFNNIGIFENIFALENCERKNQKKKCVNFENFNFNPIKNFVSSPLYNKIAYNYKYKDNVDNIFKFINYDLKKKEHNFLNYYVCVKKKDKIFYLRKIIEKMNSLDINEKIEKVDDEESEFKNFDSIFDKNNLNEMYQEKNYKDNFDEDLLKFIKEEIDNNNCLLNDVIN